MWCHCVKEKDFPVKQKYSALGVQKCVRKLSLRDLRFMRKILSEISEGLLASFYVFLYNGRKYFWKESVL